MKVLVVAGDKRQEYLCDKLKECSVQCTLFNKSDLRFNMSDYQIIILPVPISKDSVNLFSADKEFIYSLKSFFDKICEKQHIVGFNIPERYTRMSESKNFKISDLMKDENFIEYNSFLTAQGCVRLLLENTQQCVFAKKALITGFGHVSKALCRMLDSLGLDVTVCVRRPDASAQAASMGYDCICFNDMKDSICKYDFIFGTVPATVINEEHIEKIKDSSVYFEIASAPFGAKRELFDKHNKKYVFGGGLPGKYCPQSWADAVADYCISTIINKEGN